MPDRPTTVRVARLSDAEAAERWRLHVAEQLIIQAGFVPNPDKPGSYMPPPGGFPDEGGGD